MQDLIKKINSLTIEMEDFQDKYDFENLNVKNDYIKSVFYLKRLKICMKVWKKIKFQRKIFKI